MKSDKKSPMEAILECYERESKLDEFAKVNKCESFGSERQYSGVWYVGFEKSKFVSDRIDRNFSERDILKYPNLLMDEPSKIKIGVKIGPIDQIYRIKFVGKASLHANSAQDRIIVVNRLTEFIELRD